MKIYEIDALRGIAAFLVVVFHMIPFFEYIIPGNAHYLNGGSYLGVSVFFIISGFVMGASTQNDSSIRSFFLKRIFRVYVPTVVAICTFLLIHQKQINVIDAMKIIPNGGFAPYYGFGAYFITWTISYEIIFYAIYLISLKISWTNRSEIAISLILFNCLILQPMLTGDFTLNPGGCPQVTVFPMVFMNTIASFIINPINLLFVFGLLIFRFYSDFQKFVNTIDPAAIGFSLMFISIFVFFGFLFIQGHGVLQMGLCSIFLFISCLILHVIKREKELSLAERCFVFIGKISFSLYLCHYIAIDLREFYLPRNIDVRWHPAFVLLAALTLTLLFYNFVDVPVHKLGNKLAKKYTRSYNSLESKKNPFFMCKYQLL